MKTLKLTALAVLTLAVSACSNPVENKEDAAKAMQRLAFATKSAGAKNYNMAGAATQTLTATVAGKEGSATVNFSVNEETGALEAKINYDGFSADGNNTFDGNLDASLLVQLNLEDLSQGMSIDMHMSGAVTMSGDYDSDLSFDVILSMKLGDLDNLSGNVVQVTLDGWVDADGQRYTYDHETLSIDTTRS
jgi:hypothetical protein